MKNIFGQVIFGILALLAGGLALFLPETTGKQLPTNLDDTEAFYNGSNLWEFKYF